MERKSANFREQFVDESLWQGLGVIDQDELAAKFFLGVADKRRNWNLEVPPTDFHECAETLLPVDDPTGCAFADIYREFSGPGLGLLDRGPAHESKHDWVCQDRIGAC